jgi:hypothetical protein
VPVGSRFRPRGDVPAPAFASDGFYRLRVTRPSMDGSDLFFLVVLLVTILLIAVGILISFL